MYKLAGCETSRLRTARARFCLQYDWSTVFPCCRCAEWRRKKKRVVIQIVKVKESVKSKRLQENSIVI